MIFYHTWSEIPFILFMLIFALSLGRVVSEEDPSVCMYVVLAISGTLCFLTRYFGIFLWVVAGIYWLIMLVNEVSKSKENHGALRVIGTLKNNSKLMKKLIGLALSAVISVSVYLFYLIMNKIKNGAPTGVSRSDWWDDYHTLTDDLINSIITEIFNALTLDVPANIAGLDVNLKVWVIIAVDILLVTVILNVLKKNRAENKTEWLFHPGMVLIVTAIVYYAMFIVIRYRSSMDTFYFRFFAPATLLLVLGLICIILEERRGIGTAACILASVAVLALFTDCMGDIETSGGDSMYEICAAEWDVAYRDVPERSVVIWSGLDYRSTWYRPDVVGGQLYEDDTMETLRERYYGSEYMCISTEYVDAILAEGNYAAEIKDKIREASAENMNTSGDYIVIKLR